MINRLLLGVTCVVLLAAIGVWARRCPDVEGRSVCLGTLAPGSFAQVENGWAPFVLESAQPVLAVPDLRDDLIFYGKSARPDGEGELLFGLGEEVVAISGRQYLEFDGREYQLSAEPTQLWVEADGREMVVGMSTREGEQTARYVLAERQMPRIAWTLDGMRVDSSLFARLRARWYGEDLFLSEHGGEEYGLAKGRHRIDFGEGDHFYSCFVKVGEGLAWQDGRFRNAEETRGTPLLWITRLDDQVIGFELWDADGKGKVPITLMRSKGIWSPQQMRGSLRFVAARTWSEFVLDSGAERIDVGPGDWLLLDGGRWTKLATVSDIDDYVEMRQAGELLVIDGLARNDGKRILVGHLFNRSRTSAQPMEIPLSSAMAEPVAAAVAVQEERARPFRPLPQVVEELL